MRLVVIERFDVGDAQFSAGDAEAAQGEVLGDGVVFTVASPLDQRLDRGGPVVVLSPYLDVIGKAYLPVEEAIDLGELVISLLAALALICASQAWMRCLAAPRLP